MRPMTHMQQSDIHTVLKTLILLLLSGEYSLEGPEQKHRELLGSYC